MELIYFALLASLLSANDSDFSLIENKIIKRRFDINSYIADAKSSYRNGNNSNYTVVKSKTIHFMKKPCYSKIAKSSELHLTDTYTMIWNNMAIRWTRAESVAALISKKLDVHYEEFMLVDMRFIGLNTSGLIGLGGSKNPCVIANDKITFDAKILSNENNIYILKYIRNNGYSVSVYVNSKNYSVQMISAHDKSGKEVCKVECFYKEDSNPMPSKVKYYSLDQTGTLGIDEECDINWSINIDVDSSDINTILSYFELPDMTVIASELPEHKNMNFVWDNKQMRQFTRIDMGVNVFYKMAIIGFGIAIFLTSLYCGLRYIRTKPRSMAS